MGLASLRESDGSARSGIILTWDAGWALQRTHRDADSKQCFRQ